MTLEILQTTILTNKAKRIRRNGREYAVANGVILAPRVLAGSQGPLYYPAEQIKNSAPDWDQVPITLAHPKKDGRDASAFEDGILKEVGIGWLEQPAVNSKNRLGVEYWFDVQKTLKVAPSIIDNLDEGIEMEVSTGLFTENEIADNGAAFEGTPYSHIAKNYKPDHLAILLDAKGACSCQDGCGVGVLVNKANRPKIDIAKAIAEGAEDEEEPYSEDREESDERFGRTLAANRQVIANFHKEQACACYTKNKRRAVVVRNYAGSHDELRNKLHEKLRAKFPPKITDSGLVGETPWIQDVFDGYIVYMKDGKSWKLDYSETKDGDCKFEGSPMQVVRSTNYVPVKNAAEEQIWFPVNCKATGKPGPCKGQRRGGRMLADGTRAGESLGGRGKMAREQKRIDKKRGKELGKKLKSAKKTLKRMKKKWNPYAEAKAREAYFSHVGL